MRRQLACSGFEHGVLQLLCREIDQQLKPSADLVHGLAKRFELDVVCCIAFGWIGIAPVRRGRVAGTERADFTRRVVADRDDQVHFRGVGNRKLILGFAAQAVDGNACALQDLQTERIGLLVLSGAASCRESLEAALAHVVEQRLCEDASRRVVCAQEQHVQRSLCVSHDGSISSKSWWTNEERSKPHLKLPLQPGRSKRPGAVLRASLR